MEAPREDCTNRERAEKKHHNLSLLFHPIGQVQQEVRSSRKTKSYNWWGQSLLNTEQAERNKQLKGKTDSKSPVQKVNKN